MGDYFKLFQPKKYISVLHHSPVGLKTKGLLWRKALLHPSSLPHHWLSSLSHFALHFCLKPGLYPSLLLTGWPWQPCGTGNSRSHSCVLRHISGCLLHWKPERSIEDSLVPAPFPSPVCLVSTHFEFLLSPAAFLYSPNHNVYLYILSLCACPCCVGTQ